MAFSKKASAPPPNAGTASSNPMRIKKDTQLIIVMLSDQTRIKGNVHLPSSGRLSDLMNHQADKRPFLAMTGAVVRFPDGARHRTPFLTVNRQTITTCFPAPGDEEDDGMDR